MKKVSYQGRQYKIRASAVKKPIKFALLDDDGNKYFVGVGGSFYDELLDVTFDEATPAQYAEISKISRFVKKIND